MAPRIRKDVVLLDYLNNKLVLSFTIYLKCFLVKIGLIIATPEKAFTNLYPRQIVFTD